jgi:micrococcal nuclease
MRWLCSLLVVVVAAVFGACGRGAPSSVPAAEPGVATVARVVDGDTIRVRLPGGGEVEERVRLIGVDTPETHGPGGLRECFGQEAADQVAAWLPPGTKVRLVRDAEARDRYRRLLAYVYRRKDGFFVNLALAEHGFAAPLSIPPNVTHKADFVAAAADARAKSKGLWGRCGGPDTPLGSSP